MLRFGEPVDLSASIDVMLQHAGESRHTARVAAMRARFETRTGTYTPEDAWFEARSAAFWDDTLTTQRFASDLEPLLDDAVRFWLGPLARAHRGLYRATPDKGGFRLDDAWSGASYRVAASLGLADALRTATGFIDGRIVAAARPSTVDVALLSGAVFHAEDATPPIAALVPVARERGLASGDFLDALLRMDLAFRASHARVKVAFAYRKEALPRT
ncbi:hypothetical protein BH09MYX1_BH09MYX1_55420 [soil metagenome]